MMNTMAGRIRPCKKDGSFATTFVLTALLISCVTTAFQLPQNGGHHQQPQQLRRILSLRPTSLSLGMTPRFDTETQKWYPSDPEKEGPSAGYGILGSLFRAGPVPVFQRIFNGDSYEQSVLKYMAKEGVDRIEAQGNMDAYLENPNDWQYQKMCEKNKGAPKKDYANANMDPQSIVLSSVWAGVVVLFGYDLITGISEGRYSVFRIF